MKENSLSNYTISWREIGILVGGYFAAQVVIALIAVFFTFVLKQDYLSSPLFTIIAYILSLGLPILFFDLFVTRPNGYDLNFNFSVKSLPTYTLCLVMMFGMMLISEFLTGLIPTTGPIFGELYKSFVAQMSAISLDPVALIIMVAVLAPILEEILFRGIIMKAMLNNGMDPKKAIFFSALIFGAIHGYPWQFLGAFLLGLVLGLVYFKTKSLLTSILLHAFNNFIAAMMIIYTKDESFNQSFNIPELYIFISGIAIFGISYYIFTLHGNKSELETIN